MLNSGRFALCMVMAGIFISGCEQKNAAGRSAYREIKGKTVIEAEFPTAYEGAWEEVEGRNAIRPEDLGIGISKGSGHILVHSGGLEEEIRLGERQLGIGWGLYGENAHVWATVPGEMSKGIVFYYEYGDVLPDKTSAAGTRAACFNPHDSFTDAGWNLFMEMVEFFLVGSENSILLVVGDAENLGKGEKTAIGKIRERTGSITLISDDEVSLYDPEVFCLTIIFESVASDPVGNYFKNSTGSVMICEPYLLDDMGMVKQSAAWKQIEGQSGNAVLVRDPGAHDHLTYSVYFSNPGHYALWLLGMNQGIEELQEIAVIFSGKRTSVTGKVGLSSGLSWRNAVFEGGQDQVEVSRRGWYNLRIKGLSKISGIKSRYPNFRIDKIIMETGNVRPEGDEASFVGYRYEGRIPSRLLKEKEFLPDQIFVEKDGMVILEVEDIDHHPYWEMRTEPAGYSGKGYLVWNGPSRTNSIEGLGGNHDSLFVRLGPREEWLIMRLKIGQEGFYKVNAVNIHQRRDGDNDAWVNKLGFRPDRKKGEAVSRMGDSFADGEGFTWLDWGIRSFYLQKGINAVYIAGRSVGFGIDRVAIYLEGNEEIERKALDPGCAVSSRY